MNTVKDVVVELSLDSKKMVLNNFILINFLDETAECYANATFMDWAIALDAVLDGFYSSAKYMSDQDLYEACSNAGIDFDVVKEAIDERRYNG